jgi:hypothetical protein
MDRILNLLESADRRIKSFFTSGTDFQGTSNHDVSKYAMSASPTVSANGDRIIAPVPLPPLSFDDGATLTWQSGGHHRSGKNASTLIPPGGFGQDSRRVPDTLRSGISAAGIQPDEPPAVA